MARSSSWKARRDLYEDRSPRQQSRVAELRLLDLGVVSRRAVSLAVWTLLLVLLVCVWILECGCVKPPVDVRRVSFLNLLQSTCFSESPTQLRSGNDNCASWRRFASSRVVAPPHGGHRFLRGVAVDSFSSLEKATPLRVFALRSAQCASTEIKVASSCAARNAVSARRLSLPPLVPESSNFRTPLVAEERLASQVSLPTSDSLIAKVNVPADLKELTLPQLPRLCRELREEMIDLVLRIGGHFSSSLGMVECIVALLHAFDPPSDKIVYDISHQAYPHKVSGASLVLLTVEEDVELQLCHFLASSELGATQMLTGRRHLMHKLRKWKGLSGFCKRTESLYDCFGAGHSSTSVSAAQGLYEASKILGDDAGRSVVAVLVSLGGAGDGGLTGGMAFEALNSCGYLQSRILVVFNENHQISLPTGLPTAGGTGPARAFCRRREKGGAGVASLKEIVESMGLNYRGPFDGHDVQLLADVFGQVKRRGLKAPTFVHLQTVKGQGFAEALAAQDRMHGVKPNTFAALKKKKNKKELTREETAAPVSSLAFSEATSFTCIASRSVSRFVESEKQSDFHSARKGVVAVTAAMGAGTGVSLLSERNATRVFDVALAEQHAVGFAAGLAANGAKPFCFLYSTFLQRSFDQVVHDVALQKLPVRFIIDRAGFVGEDGATHQGSFDLTMLCNVPNMVVLAPSDEKELIDMMQTAYEFDSGPISVRFPKSGVLGIETLNKLGHSLTALPETGRKLEIGKGRVVRRAASCAVYKVAFLTLGTPLLDAVNAADYLSSLTKLPCRHLSNRDEAAPALVDGKKGLTERPLIGVTVADARFAKPLDLHLLQELAATHDALVVAEEGASGGFCAVVLGELVKTGALDAGTVKVRCLTMPDIFVDAGTRQQQLQHSGLTSQRFIHTVLDLVNAAA